MIKNNIFSLKNKNALITGGGGLLGQEHAKALLDSECRVILIDLNFNKVEKYLINHKNVIIKKTDITSIKSLINLRNFINKKKIKIDILINNAAINSKPGKIKNLDQQIKEWKKELEVSLTGNFLCTKIIGEIISKNPKGGVILNISSDLALISPDQRLYRKNKLTEKNPSYSVVKHGITGLTKYFATYWADKNVRCNALLPGGIKNKQKKAFIKDLTSRIPLNRMADKNEYHGSIKFLCSDASKYMNGQSLVLDGGRTIW